MRRRLALLLSAALLAGCTSAPEPAPPQPQPTLRFTAPATTAAGSTLFGAHWDWNRYEQFEPYLRKLAGSRTYYELSWCDLEKTQGNPDFTALDSIAGRSRALGITLDLKIRVGTCWATGGTARHVRGTANKTESAMPLDLAAYQTFVSTLVDRYRPYGVRQYAIENEVNAQQYWAGTPDQYEQLVRAAAAAIHGADPQAVVVDSGISSVANGMGVANRLLQDGKAAQAVAAYTGYFARRVGTRGKQIPQVSDEDGLRTALAQDANVRNLAYLAVTEKLVREGVVAVRQLHFYEHPDGIAPLLDYLKATTPAKVPVQAWEVGRFDKTASAAATEVTGEMTKVVSELAAGGVTGIVWLPLAYNPQNKAGAEVRYGLLDPDGTERPTGAALASLADAARGRTAQKIDAGGVEGVAFGGSGTRLVVWSEASPVAVPKGLTGAGSIGGEPVLLQTELPVGKAVAELGK